MMVGRMYDEGDDGEVSEVEESISEPEGSEDEEDESDDEAGGSQITYGDTVCTNSSYHPARGSDTVVSDGNTSNPSLTPYLTGWRIPIPGSASSENSSGTVGPCLFLDLSTVTRATSWPSSPVRPPKKCI